LTPECWHEDRERLHRACLADISGQCKFAGCDKELEVEVQLEWFERIVEAFFSQCGTLGHNEARYNLGTPSSLRRDLLFILLKQFINNKSR
jgi:hypothetical protein